MPKVVVIPAYTPAYQIEIDGYYVATIYKAAAGEWVAIRDKTVLPGTENRKSKQEIIDDVRKVFERKGPKAWAANKNGDLPSLKKIFPEIKFPRRK